MYFFFYFVCVFFFFFFFSSRRRHTRSLRDWSSDVCSSDLGSRLLAFKKKFVSSCLPQPGQQRVNLRHGIAAATGKIGRASCRGKSVDLGGRRIIKKKRKKESRSMCTGRPGRRTTEWT